MEVHQQLSKTFGFAACLRLWKHKSGQTWLCFAWWVTRCADLSYKNTSSYLLLFMRGFQFHQERSWRTPSLIPCVIPPPPASTQDGSAILSLRFFKREKGKWWTKHNANILTSLSIFAFKFSPLHSLKTCFYFFRITPWVTATRDKPVGHDGRNKRTWGQVSHA